MNIVTVGTPMTNQFYKDCGIYDKVYNFTSGWTVPLFQQQTHWTHMKRHRKVENDKEIPAVLTAINIFHTLNIFGTMKSLTT